MNPSSKPDAQPAVLLELILLTLIPLFLPATGSNPDQARAAALQTISAWGSDDPADLLLIAQSVTFSLAALDTIRLSTQPGHAPATILRLRGNAVSLGRSADRARSALHRRHTPAPRPRPAAPRPAPPAQPVAPTRPDPARTAAWAAAFTDLAHEVAAGADAGDPTMRLRANALSSAASTLLSVPQARPPLG